MLFCNQFHPPLAIAPPLNLDVIQKRIFPTLTKQQSFRLLVLFLVLVWSVAIAGLGTWLFVKTERNATSFKVLYQPSGSTVVQAHVKFYLDGQLRANLYTVEGGKNFAVERIVVEQPGEYYYKLEVSGFQRLNRQDLTTVVVPLNVTGSGTIPILANKLYRINVGLRLGGPEGNGLYAELDEFERSQLNDLPDDVVTEILEELDRQAASENQ